MFRPLSALMLVVSASLLVPPSGEAAVIYRSGEGWSVEGDPGSKLEGSSAEQMRKAENLEASGDLNGAFKAYQGLVKNYSKSALAPKAQRKVGMLLEQRGDYDKAFNAYSTYLEKYASGSDFDGVVESMFNIGKLFLDGQKKKLFGVPIAPSMDRAKQMFEEIVKRAPYSKWAPVAQFNIGQAAEKQGDYPGAIDAYRKVVNKYPNDAIADDAQYQIGYVLMRESNEGSYDKANAARARESFEDFINRYPNSEKVPQAKQNMEQLAGGAVKGKLDVAKFYDKQKQYKAAVIYYNDVIQLQPGTPDAEYAKNRIEILKQTVGEDALRAGPERSETGARAAARRKLKAKVDTASRPDYVGPPVVLPEEPIESAPTMPRLRTSPSSIGPVPAVEPALPAAPEKLPSDTGLPVPQ
jgi:outer membrane protein assembly factor BamD